MGGLKEVFLVVENDQKATERAMERLVEDCKNIKMDGNFAVRTLLPMDVCQF
jgi:hypothetical protein